MYIYRGMRHGSHVEVRGQYSGVGSLFVACILVVQLVWEVFLFAESACWPLLPTFLDEILFKSFLPLVLPSSNQPSTLLGKTHSMKACLIHYHKYLLKWFLSIYSWLPSFCIYSQVMLSIWVFLAYIMFTIICSFYCIFLPFFITSISYSRNSDLLLRFGLRFISQLSL